MTSQRAAAALGAGLARAARLTGLVGLGASALSCLQTIDLRGAQEPPPPLVCGEGERINPDTGDCESCRVDSPPPEQVCPCSFTTHAAPFPYCEGDDAAYECQLCVGDITSCRAYNPATLVVSSCDLLADCCTELAAVRTSKPCCPFGARLVCAPGANLGEYSLRCEEMTCCSGAACPNGDSDCASWQACDLSSQRCVPACNPDVEECRASDCVCVDLQPPL